MFEENYHDPEEVTYFNPFQKQIDVMKNLENPPTTEELLALIQTMGDYIGKLESKISRLRMAVDE